MRKTAQNGLATVEFVLVASLVFLPLFLGVITVGLRYYQHNTLTKAVHDAARYYGMKCVGDKHGTSQSGAYGGALKIFAANIEVLNVKFGGGDVSDELAARTDISCLKYDENNEEQPFSLFLSGGLSCNDGCQYVRLTSPKDQSSFLFPFWEDKTSVVSISPILR